MKNMSYFSKLSVEIKIPLKEGTYSNLNSFEAVQHVVF